MRIQLNNHLDLKAQGRFLVRNSVSRWREGIRKQTEKVVGRPTNNNQSNSTQYYEV